MTSTEENLARELGAEIDTYGIRPKKTWCIFALAAWRKCLALTTQRITILCPKNHAERQKDCKHCGILTDLESESRDGLAKLILMWHDAFYREENRAVAAENKARELIEQAPIAVAHELGAWYLAWPTREKEK